MLFNHSLTRSLGLTVGLLCTISLAACSSSSTPASPDYTGAGGAGGAGGAQTLFDKYGGAPTVSMIVDQAVSGVLADPMEMPFFGVVGMGYDAMIPAYARKVLATGVTGYSILLSSSGVGATLGALTVATLAFRVRKEHMVQAGLALFAHRSPGRLAKD